MIVEPAGKPAQLDHVMAPVRQRIGEILAGYSAEQLDVLFDYFTRAAQAYQEAAEHSLDGDQRELSSPTPRGPGRSS